jgi:hypothetical protein
MESFKCCTLYEYSVGWIGWISEANVVKWVAMLWAAKIGMNLLIYETSYDSYDALNFFTYDNV